MTLVWISGNVRLLIAKAVAAVADLVYYSLMTVSVMLLEIEDRSTLTKVF